MQYARAAVEMVFHAIGWGSFLLLLFILFTS
jgi:hypothetical protein